MSGLFMSYMGKNVIVIYEAFSNSWFKDGFCLIKLCVSIYAMKMLERKLLSLCLSRCRGSILIVLSIKRERIFFED